MVRKAKLINKNFTELTKDELKSMIRTQDRPRPSVKKMIDYYNIELDYYLDYIQVMGFRLTGSERRQAYEIRNNDTKVTIKDYGFEVNLPDKVLCAMFDIDYEIIGGAVYYDVEQIRQAREQVRNKMLGYYERQDHAREKREEEIITKYKPIDLVALRIYRGVSREKMATKTLKTMGEVKEMESTSPVPKWIVDLYMRELKASRRHIMQLRKIMLGKSDKVIDNRNLPQLVKLRVWKRDKAKCTHCGSKEKLHYHHIEHYADGGQNTVENLKLLCASCHAEVHKHDKSYYMLKSIAEE